MQHARILLLCAVVSLWQCSHEPHGHSHGSQSDQHDHAGLPTQQITIWNQDVELFMEHEIMIAERPTSLITHITLLSNGQPKSDGTVFFRLKHPDHMTVVFEEEQPIRPGIYRPDVTFPSAGSWTLAVTVGLADQQSTEIDIPVTVLASADEHIPQSDDNDSAVSFLKEQQWQTDFRSEPASMALLSDSIRAFGVIAAPAGAELVVAAPLDGRIRTSSQPLHMGDRVQEGSVMFSIQPHLADSDDPAGLQHAVEKAALTLQYASRERDRLRNLVTQEAIPTTRLQKADLDVNQAKADLANAEARQKQARAQSGGDAIEIEAPITGELVMSNIADGAFVRKGDVLLQIIDTSRVCLEASVPAGDAIKASSSQGAWFRVEGVDRRFQVRQDQLVGRGRKVDPTTRTVPFVFELTNEDRLLDVGLYAELKLLIGAPQERLAIPVSSVLTQEGQDVVYVHKSGESFERKVVTLGIRDAEWVHVIRGLSAGERVVSTGTYLVHLASMATSVPAHGHAH